MPKTVGHNRPADDDLLLWFFDPRLHGGYIRLGRTGFGNLKLAVNHHMLVQHPAIQQGGEGFGADVSHLPVAGRAGLPRRHWHGLVNEGAFNFKHPIMNLIAWAALEQKAATIPNTTISTPPPMVMILPLNSAHWCGRRDARANFVHRAPDGADDEPINHQETAAPNQAYTLRVLDFPANLSPVIASAAIMHTASNTASTASSGNINPSNTASHMP